MSSPTPFQLAASVVVLMTQGLACRVHRVDPEEMQGLGAAASAAAAATSAPDVSFGEPAGRCPDIAGHHGAG